MESEGVGQNPAELEELLGFLVSSVDDPQRTGDLDNS